MYPVFGFSQNWSFTLVIGTLCGSVEIFTLHVPSFHPPTEINLLLKVKPLDVKKEQPNISLACSPHCSLSVEVERFVSVGQHGQGELWVCFSCLHQHQLSSLTKQQAVHQALTDQTIAIYYCPSTWSSLHKYLCNASLPRHELFPTSSTETTYSMH